MAPKSTSSIAAPVAPKRPKRLLIVIGPTNNWCEAVEAQWNDAEQTSLVASKLLWNDFLYNRQPLRDMLEEIGRKKTLTGTILVGWRPPNRILWEKQLLALGDELTKSSPKKAWNKLGIHVSPHGLPGVAMHDERPAALQQFGFIDLCEKIEDAVTIGRWKSSLLASGSQTATPKPPQDFHSRIRHFLLVLQDIDSTRDRESAKSSVPARNQFIEEMIREIQGDKQTAPVMNPQEHLSAAQLLAAVLARESRLIDDKIMTATIDSVLGNFQSPVKNVKATANDYLIIAALCLAIDPRDVRGADISAIGVDSRGILVKNPGHHAIESSSRLVEVHTEFLEFIKHNEAAIGNHRIEFDVEHNGIAIHNA